MIEIYEQLILRKANQFIQARLNAAVPTLDSGDANQRLVTQQRAKIIEMAKQAVLRSKKEEADQQIKAEGRFPKDEDYRIEASEEEVAAAANAIAEAVLSASIAQMMVDQQTLGGL